MKLLHCNKCGDVVALRIEGQRSCYCGASSGAYLQDGLNAWLCGPATPLGFQNSSFERALHNRPPADARRGILFEAFVIEHDCRTFEERK